ncbi:Hypothetical protein PHPALM_18587, partial [Phytophthora palmivora]
MASIIKAEPTTNVSSPTRPGDSAVLMRGGRGRGRRMRVISKTKLPRMNNSERGKFYRQKYREYEEQLDRDVQRLQGEVHELQRLLELRQLLPHQYPRVSLDEVQAATQVVYEGLIRLHERWTPTDRRSESPVARALLALDSDEIRSAERVHTPRQLELCSSQSEFFIARHQDTTTSLLFKLESVEIQGCSDSRIVMAHDDLSFVSVDVDAIGGLLALIPNLHCVEALLSPMIYPNHSGLKEEPTTTEARINANYYDRPALLAAAIRAVDKCEEEK